LGTPFFQRKLFLCFVTNQPSSLLALFSFLSWGRFLEKTDLAFIFEAFPVVILRLFRLLRVFRLAKAFPRLRSIVEALISGLTSVGWICLLILVYQYIAGCLCMLVFRENVSLCFDALYLTTFSLFFETFSNIPSDLKIKRFRFS
jgi:hypothetical protein